MTLGIILACASGGLFWRSFTERRLLSHYGYAIMSLAVMFSAFRRFVYQPITMFQQVGLDWVVCCIFFAGAMVLVADRVMERRHAKREGHKLPGRGAWMILPAMLVLMAPGPWTWGGERSDLLTYEQVVAALDGDMHVPAALVRAKQMAVVLIGRLEAVADKGSGEESAMAQRKLRCLKSKLEKVQ